MRVVLFCERLHCKRKIFDTFKHSISYIHIFPPPPFSGGLITPQENYRKLKAEICQNYFLHSAGSDIKK